MSKFHELQVKTIDRETPQAVSVGFEIPSKLKDEFRFVAGQYLTLEKEIAGRKFRRSYSICTSPKKETLKVTVKEVEGGLFSVWVNKKLKVGDSLNVFLPEGRFTFEPARRNGHPKSYAAFAAGSGITPVMSILQNVLETEPHSRFVLVYGNKTPDQTIFYKDLLELQKQFPDRLFIEFVYSKSKEEKSFFGRIERSTVNYVVKNKFKHHDFEGFYLCGPEPMIDMVSGVLQENGVDKTKIHQELFVADNQEKEIDKAAQVSGKTKVTVMLDGEETTFEMDRSQRVLDAIMDEGLDPPYSCQGGICSSCMAQLSEGKVEMVNNQILTDEEVEEGSVLTCQSHPTTPTLYVDYDDI